MHAVARLALDPLIPNIQASWVKMGPDGAAPCLRAGANDLGGVLMDESITRAAGAVHGQEMTPRRWRPIIRALGRTPRQRTRSTDRAGRANRAARGGSGLDAASASPEHAASPPCRRIVLIVTNNSTIL